MCGTCTERRVYARSGPLSSPGDPVKTLAPSAAAAGTFRLGGDLTIHRLGFGAMRITGPGIWGEPHDPEECKRVLRRAVELQVNFIDTADSYGPYVSERLIAEALYPYPDGLVIATKGGLVRDGPDQWRPDGRPSHLREACNGSLERLRVQRIDLYQLHRPDPNVPFEESLGALVELKREGKIRHIGLSNINVDQLTRALGLTPVVSIQNRYNVEDRGSEGVLRQCERMGLAFLPWRPLEGGQIAPTSALARIAQRLDATPAQVAIAWQLAHSAVTVPIPGTSKVRHLEENIAAAALELSSDDLRELDSANPTQSQV